jgi:hypothetical protein
MRGARHLDIAGAGYTGRERFSAGWRKDNIVRGAQDQSGDAAQLAHAAPGVETPQRLQLAHRDGRSIAQSVTEEGLEAFRQRLKILRCEVLRRHNDFEECSRTHSTGADATPKA